MEYPVGRRHNYDTQDRLSFKKKILKLRLTLLSPSVSSRGDLERSKHSSELLLNISRYVSTLF